MSALGALTDFKEPADTFKTSFISSDDVPGRTYKLDVWLYADTKFSTWKATAENSDKSPTDNEKEFMS